MSGIASAHELLGVPLPFPAADLIVAICTIAAFLPTVVVVNWLVAKLFPAVNSKYGQKPKAA